MWPLTFKNKNKKKEDEEGSLYVHVSLSELAFSIHILQKKLGGTRAQYCTVPQSKRSSWGKYEIVLMWFISACGKPL